MILDVPQNWFATLNPESLVPIADKDLGSLFLFESRTTKERGLAWIAAETGTAKFAGTRMV